MATKAQNFAQNVRAWMKVRGLTLQDTAEQTGIDYRLLQRWASKGVSRRSRATEKEFLLLANAMGFYERRAHWLFWELNESWSKRSPIARPPALMELLEQVESVVRFGKMTTRSEMLSAIRKAHEATVNEIKEREKPSPFQIDEMRWIDDRKKDDPRNQIDSAPDPPARTSSTPPFKLDPLAQQRGESDATKSSKPVKARAKTTHRTIVKWTGSKRRQAAEILRHFPRQIETYYEPFLGGGSLLLNLLSSEVQVKRFRCSDIYAPLIGIWNVIKDEPSLLCHFYEHFWNELQRRGVEFYYEVRTRFNEDRDPLKLFALLSTCRNGFVRFNKEAEFNSGFHHQRRGIQPKWLRPLLEECSGRLNAVDVQFEAKDYRSVELAPGDFLYLDPPYEMPEGRRTVMYTGEFDLSAMWPWLEKQRGSYALSLGGFRGEEDRRVDVPDHLYDEAFLIESPNAFHRMTNRKVIAQDSLYVRLKSPPQ